MKKIVAAGLALILIGIAATVALVVAVNSSLPQMMTLQDYQPLLVSEVYDRNGNKIGEFFREKRMLIPYKDIPQNVINAFVSAEDSSFFHHEGLNYVAIVRAFFANIRAGRKVQGGSTITQQVARSILLLDSEKTYLRKIKEAMLSRKMEKNFSKEDILYLYLNQIYLGQGAHGIEAAAQVYFRKAAKDLTVPEAALLAGLPQAPSRYSPISNPLRAKERQRYVLTRMAEEGYITAQEAAKFAEEPVTVYVWKSYKEIAPYYLETIRQMLVAKLGEEMVLDRGIKIYTGLDLSKQQAAQNEVQNGLRDLDKRQGYRGALKNLESPEAVATFLVEERNTLMDENSPERILQPNGTIASKGPLNLTGKDANGQPVPNLPDYISQGQIVKGVVIKVDDTWGLVQVRFAESKGLIDIETMKWARAPDPKVRADSAQIKKPSQALKQGDVIQIRVARKNFSSSRLNKDLAEFKKKHKTDGVQADIPELAQFAEVELEQDPIAEAALVSIDQKTDDIVALVGGYDYTKSQFNRAIQALRQTGSSFKSFVYAAALDKNYTPSSTLMDAPIVYEEQDKAAEPAEGQDATALATKKWKPANFERSFEGEVLFRNALIRSLNVPTVKITEDIGVDWITLYARRLGIFSPLNPDFTLALGSSGVTVYEMTKAFAILANLGHRVKPILIHKVVDKVGSQLLGDTSLDERFTAEIQKADEEVEKRRPAPDANEEALKKIPPIFFKDPDQLIKPQTAYVLTTILQGVIDETGGTGGAARAIGRPAAGKTGSTSGYYDAWFLGYTPDITTGVWVGFDEEKTLGVGEVGGKAALPIWLGYMKEAHNGIAAHSFPAPEGVVFANIDNETGRLATASSKQVVRQAFVEGTEPQAGTPEQQNSEESQQFLKEDLSD